ncbi:CYTH domain-containing protein [Mangrovicoccus ximenensis]|uniref:CYTH domain-containing protein n=1 Tax=Mangrovicoccus ximenensis TaxID=1911570 RepID=UPI001374D09A|nr:CYTH domain-containing protein [Mangrovicoccus ximenensis]
MAKEIERKFLVSGESWRRDARQVTELRDGLMSYDNGRKVRVRCIGDTAVLTLKGPKSGFTRDEFEYEIPFEDAQVLLDRHCPFGQLCKTRHILSCGGFEWTVDEYHGSLDGVIIAEVELPSEDTTFALPGWLGREITDCPEYRTGNMVKRHPEAGRDRQPGRTRTAAQDQPLQARN